MKLQLSPREWQARQCGKPARKALAVLLALMATLLTVGLTSSCGELPGPEPAAPAAVSTPNPEALYRQQEEEQWRQQYDYKKAQLEAAYQSLKRAEKQRDQALEQRNAAEQQFQRAKDEYLRRLRPENTDALEDTKYSSEDTTEIKSETIRVINDATRKMNDDYQKQQLELDKLADENRKSRQDNIAWQTEMTRLSNSADEYTDASTLLTNIKTASLRQAVEIALDAQEMQMGALEDDLDRLKQAHPKTEETLAETREMNLVIENRLGQNKLLSDCLLEADRLVTDMETYRDQAYALEESTELAPAARTMLERLNKFSESCIERIAASAP